MSAGIEVWPGVPYPLGATCDGQGVNFALFSAHAEGVELCLFDSENPEREMARLALQECTNHVWHGYVPGLKKGALYGFRVRGPYAPEKGLRFNSSKLLVDPYARAFFGQVQAAAPVEGYVRSAHEDADLQIQSEDSAWGVPRCVVTDDVFNWEGVERPAQLWRKTLIYEMHVKGFTKLHPGIPPELRGTYLGVAHPASIEHFKRLGVTALQLLPIHESMDEGFLTEKDLTNYWGYNSLGFFAPAQRFTKDKHAGAAVTEFKQMVKALHKEGIEVLLDVVFNHTCEGNQYGPTLSFRGIDNPTYYWLSEEPRFYKDFTGCGNTLNVRHPQVVKLICDSLRYWVEEMHVDGFRFDLAATLGRVGDGDFVKDAPLFQAIHQDPLLSRVKLIAEPWDVGMNGYRLGQFPIAWAEWNGRYRDTLRRFWKGEENVLSEVGYRLSGSSDLFKLSGRRATSSINYITSHDGFPLHDLVSYENKHNEANLEGNKDGGNDNNSWNCGVEGETAVPEILELRERHKRNLLTSLLMSIGTPMLCAGDELGRSQKGNNNAYCQDNEVSWLNWSLSAAQQAHLAFTQHVLGLRKSEPVIQRRNFFRGQNIADSRFRDLVWFRPDGAEMTPDDWAQPSVRALAYLLGGDAITAREPNGQRIVGDTLLVLINGSEEATHFIVPAVEWGKHWEVAVDTRAAEQKGGQVDAGGTLTLIPFSMVVLRHPSGG